MFTGLITDIGTVSALVPAGAAQDLRIEIATGWDVGGIADGASVACDGCCLTVVAREAGRLAFQASAETLARTTLGGWSLGRAVNLERSLRLGDELGGHLVYGHVDAVGTLVSRVPEGGSLRMVFALPRGLGRFVAEKGSIAVDGVSLTVNAVADTGGADGPRTEIGVNIIPHTQRLTTLGGMAPGRRVNMEVDMLARYVARLRETER
jgi:riboflavin synthase